jgi:lipid-A-disaccharide synthase
VPELVASSFSVKNIKRHLHDILQGPARETMLRGYDEVKTRLGNDCAPENAAEIMLQTL